jgi:hypothetical protein
MDLTSDLNNCKEEEEAKFCEEGRLSKIGWPQAWGESLAIATGLVGAATTREK